MDINRKRRDFRHVGKLIDTFNIGIAAIIFLSAVMIFVDFEKYSVMFPVLFIASAIMNSLKAFKVYKMRENMHALVLCGATFVMLTFAIVAFVVIV